MLRYTWHGADCAARHKPRSQTCNDYTAPHAQATSGRRRTVRKRERQPVANKPLHESRCRCGRGEPSPGAYVAVVCPVPVQMWEGRAQSRCRCGRGEPSPVVDVAVPSPFPGAPVGHREAPTGGDAELPRRSSGLWNVPTRRRDRRRELGLARPAGGPAVGTLGSAIAHMHRITPWPPHLMGIRLNGARRFAQCDSACAPPMRQVGGTRGVGVWRRRCSRYTVRRVGGSYLGHPSRASLPSFGCPAGSFRYRCSRCRQRR
jgi:hypothetical protein